MGVGGKPRDKSFAEKTYTFASLIANHFADGSNNILRSFMLKNSLSDVVRTIREMIRDEARESICSFRERLIEGHRFHMFSFLPD